MCKLKRFQTRRYSAFLGPVLPSLPLTAVPVVAPLPVRLVFLELRLVDVGEEADALEEAVHHLTIIIS